MKEPQKDNKPWKTRKEKPLNPSDRADAFVLFKRIVAKAGLPPLSLIYELLKKGDNQ